MRAVIHFDEAILKRPVGFNRQLRRGADDRAQVAPGIFHSILNAEPGRIVIGHLDVLDARQIDHIQLESLGAKAGGFDVIFDRLRQSGKQEFELRAARAGDHQRLFPLRGAPILSHESNLRRLEAGGAER